MGDAVIRASGGVLVRDGLILLGKRSDMERDYPGTWDVIGGQCEPGESDEETLVRELREELGVAAVEYRSLGIFLEPEDRPLYRLHLFVVERWLGMPTNCSAEHSTIEWHDPLRLDGLTLASARYREIFAKL
jgi:8-oxo-dGTP diphosphatase